MTELVFEPGGGLKDLPIGSSKESVRAFFGKGHQPFSRSSDSYPADYWSKEGIFAYYDVANLLEALEFSEPSEPTLHGICLTTTSLSGAIDVLRSLDPKLHVEQDGAISKKLGIGIWSSGELDQPVESVITFGPGYYD
jgi:hypothetical protein